jgi:hypothetical protein
MARYQVGDVLYDWTVKMSRIFDIKHFWWRTWKEANKTALGSSTLILHLISIENFCTWASIPWRATHKSHINIPRQAEQNLSKSNLPAHWPWEDHLAQSPSSSFCVLWLSCLRSPAVRARSLTGVQSLSRGRCFSPRRASTPRPLVHHDISTTHIVNGTGRKLQRLLPETATSSTARRRGECRQAQIPCITEGGEDR